MYGDLGTTKIRKTQKSIKKPDFKSANNRKCGKNSIEVTESR